MSITGKITEIFESIQGEGLYAGESQLFVRFFGCNLNCGFCDTKTSLVREYSVEAVVKIAQLCEKHIHSIAFTGGEPLLQKDFLKEVMRRTHSLGIRNYLETNGTLPEALEEVIPYTDIVAMDFKLPTSTGEGALWDEHARFLKTASAVEVFVKTVISKSTQESDMLRALQLLREVNPHTVLVLQHNSFEMGEYLEGTIKHFKNICEAQDIVTCAIPQLHKMMGVR